MWIDLVVKSFELRHVSVASSVMTADDDDGDDGG